MHFQQRPSRYQGGVASTLSLLALVGGVAGAAPASGPNWVARYQGAENTNNALDLVVDSSGNSYVVGRSGEVDDGRLFVARYNSAGQRQWVTSYASEDNVNHVGRAALDGNGNLLVAASSQNEESPDQIVVLKFSNAGNLVWDTPYPVPDALTDVFRDMAVDAGGDVFVAGQKNNDLDGSVDLQVIKFDGDSGEEIWTASVAGEEETEQFAAALAVDGAGGVYVAGNQTNALDAPDGLVVKLDAANGAEIWTSVYDGAEGLGDIWNDIVVTGAGVAVTGTSESAEGTDFATIKYNAADGQQVWDSHFDGTAVDEDSQDAANAIAADSAGNVYVTGYSTGTSAAGVDFTTIKYNGQTGSQVWLARYDGPGAEEKLDLIVDEARDLQVDANGNVYVTGNAVASGFRYDIATVKYNASGQQQWAQVYNGRGLDDFAQALGLDGAGNVYVAGTATVREREDSDNDSEIVVLKYLPAGRGTPTPRVAKSTFTFTESARDRIACVREEGETFCDEATTMTFRVNTTATLEGIDLTEFDADTSFLLSVGTLDIEAALGDDPRYRPGKTTARIIETVFDDNDRERKALTINLSWARGKLRATVTSTALYESSIMAEEFQDVETGPISESTTASVSLGDFVQEFDVAVTGRVKTRTTRDEEFTLSTVTLKGKGTPTEFVKE